MDVKNIYLSRLEIIALDLHSTTLALGWCHPAEVSGFASG